MNPVQKHDPVPFVGQGPLLPHRKLILHPRHHARNGALRQGRLAQQRPESPADAAAIDAAEIAAQQRLIHLSGPSRIARQDGAPKLGRRPILVAQASPRHRHGPRPVAEWSPSARSCRDDTRAAPIYAHARRPPMPRGALPRGRSRWPDARHHEAWFGDPGETAERAKGLCYCPTWRNPPSP